MRVNCRNDSSSSVNIGQVRERPAGQVGEDLLHDGVVAVLAFGLEELERGIGEDRVVGPDGKHLGLPGCCPPFQVTDRQTISRQ